MKAKSSVEKRSMIVNGKYLVDVIFTPSIGGQQRADVELPLTSLHDTALVLIGYAQGAGWGKLAKCSMCVQWCDEKSALPTWYDGCNGKLWADDLKL